MTALSEAPQLVTPNQLAHPKYRPDIDGLRAIAVLSVVVFHAFPSLIRGGFVGVDVFFVISGYLISSIILKSLAQNSFSFTEFYSRRVNRIFPALLLMMSATWAFGWLSLLSDEYTQLGKHMTGGAAFVSNLVLLGESGYFDNSGETKILLHLWSLGIEEQFYLIWPLIMWAAWKTRLNAVIVIVLVGGVSFAMNVASVHAEPIATFYSPQTRFWELLVGSLLAYCTVFKRNLPLTWLDCGNPSIRNKSSILGMSLLALALFFTTKDNQFPGWWALLPTIGTSLLIAAGPFAWINRTVLSSQLFVWFGAISFPLYLWHWPLLTFARIIHSGTPSVAVRVGVVLGSVAMAWLTYRLVELPLRRRRSTLQPFILLVFMALAGIFGYITFVSGGLPNRSAVINANTVNSQFVATTGWKYARNETCLTRYNYSGAKTLPWWFCTTNRDLPPTTVIIGNSYANHLYPGIVHAAPEATVLSIGTCDPGYTVNAELPGNPCSLDLPKRQNEFIDTIIKNSGSVKTVIIDGLFSFRGPEYTEAIISRISYMEALGIKVVVFVPHLVLDYNPRSCFARPFKAPERDCTISVSERQRLLDGFSEFRSRLSSRFKNVLFYDQNDTFCSAETCTMILDGRPAYRDEYYHYSEYASEQVGKDFIRWAKDHHVDLK